MVARQVSLKGKVAAVTGVGRNRRSDRSGAGRGGAAVAIPTSTQQRRSVGRSGCGPRNAAEGLPLDVTSSARRRSCRSELERRHGAWTCP